MNLDLASSPALYDASRIKRQRGKKSADVPLKMRWRSVQAF